MSRDPSVARKNYLREYLRVAPVSIALWRAIEAKIVATEQLPDPVLDLGCGFGEFASLFFDDPIYAGIDIRRDDLARATRDGRYQFVSQADARQMPFPSESFASVISISVLEHIPRMEEAVSEAFRVLKSGGVFVFTTPTSSFNEFLFYNRMLKRVGLSPLSRLYTALLNRAFYHVSLIGEEDWLRLLGRIGFRVERHRTTHSRRTAKAFELMLPLAFPSQISRLLLGHRGGVRPDWLVNFWERRLSNYMEEDEDDGCNLFVVARKP